MFGCRRLAVRYLDEELAVKQDGKGLSTLTTCKVRVAIARVWLTQQTGSISER